MSDAWLVNVAEGIDPLRFIARITIEFETPVLIGTGRDDKESDQVLLRDIHGLPVIPGTSLTGVLSHTMTDLDDPAAMTLRNSVFGSVFRTANGSEPGTIAIGSRLRVSDGYFHDATDTPVPQSLDYAPNDAVVDFGMIGLHRDRVRLNGRGTSDGRGKFEYVMCPAGARFTFELDLGWGSFREDEFTDAQPDFETGREIWNGLLNLLRSPASRLGSSTRSGLGAFKVVAAKQGIFWLPQKDTPLNQNRPDFADLGFEDFADLPVNLSQPCPLLKNALDLDEGSSDIAAVTLRNIHAVDGWVFGGNNPDSEADITSLMEYRILWSGTGNHPGIVSDKPFPVAPASGIKGALVHRTRWHYRRIKGHWFDDGANSEADDSAETLFGKVEDKRHQSRAGSVLFTDLVPTNSHPLSATHNSLDRFTNGVRAGFLFNEDIQQGGNLGDMQLLIDTKFTKDVEPTLRKAFDCALEDLASGLLQLGGGTGRGHGIFAADVHKDDTAKHWFGACV